MGNRLRLLATKIKAALWKAITTEQVRPFVWVYYVALWVWGIYGTFFAAPATYVQPVMGQQVYDVWVWLHIAATTIVMCGLSMESRAVNPSGGPLWNTSIRLQTGGHACMFFVLLAYELSAISATKFGEGTYSIFVISPYVLGCLLLTVQGMAKITVTRGEKVSTVVTVILCGGIMSILIGIVMAWLAAVFDEKRYPMVMGAGPVYWSYALWTLLLGVVLMLSPPYWFGPSWSYFPQLPHNGFGMGLCCSILSALLMIALRLNASSRVLSVMFFLIGFVYWTAGIILGAEGLLGRRGLMEALFMMPWGAIAFTLSALLMVYRGRR